MCNSVTWLDGKCAVGGVVLSACLIYCLFVCVLFCSSSQCCCCQCCSIYIYVICSSSFLYVVCAPCGLRGCKNWPAPFPGRMSYKVAKPGLVYVSYLNIHYMVSLFIRVPFYVLLVFIAVCAVFWLLWLSYQYLPSDWLERLVCVPILLC